MGCLHDPANVQQTSSKCIQNTRVNAGRLLDKHPITDARQSSPMTKLTSASAEQNLLQTTSSDLRVRGSDWRDVVQR